MVLRARRRTAGGTASLLWARRPGLLGYVVQFIAVALLASVQAMKQRKFFARLGGAVEVILRENMKPQLGNIALPRKADKISQAEECYQTIGLQQTLAMGASSILIFQ